MDREKLLRLAAEAKAAWQEVIKAAKEAKCPADKPREQWLSEWKEKVEKAKADYVEACNKINQLDQTETWDKEFAEAERQANEATNRLDKYKDKPLPGELAEARLERMERQEATRLARTMLGEYASSSQISNLARYYVRNIPEYTRLSRRFPVLKDTKVKDAHERFFRSYLRHGGKFIYQKETAELQQLVPKECFALLTTADPGFLVPEDFQAEVIRDVAGRSAFRQVARTERTGRDTLVFPTVVPAAQARADQGYTSGFTGSWKAQRTASGGATALTVQDQPTFGQERIQVHRWEPDTIELSMETLEDSEADVFGMLGDIIAETRALDEDSEFLNGDGQGRPMGILNESLRNVVSGAAAALTYGGTAGASPTGIIGLHYSLRAQYRNNGTYMMNSLTFGGLLTVEDTGNTLVFPPNAPPNTVLMRPVVFNEFMADIAAAANVIIFGDFQFYVIADRMDLRIIRLEERMAPNVGILPVARVGGQMVRLNAFRRQNVSA